jgi:hypothetical protein
MIPKSGNRFSEKKLERDDDSKKSHHVLTAARTRREQVIAFLEEAR